MPLRVANLVPAVAPRLRPQLADDLRARGERPRIVRINVVDVHVQHAADTPPWAVAMHAWFANSDDTVQHLQLGARNAPVWPSVANPGSFREAEDAAQPIHGRADILI